MLCKANEIRKLSYAIYMIHELQNFFYDGNETDTVAIFRYPWIGYYRPTLEVLLL